MAEKIFVNGFISNDVPATAPDFILGKGAFYVPGLIKWLEENRNLADDKGYINFTTLRSKTTGKRYTEVDTYKKPVAETAEPTPEVKAGGYTGPELGSPTDYDGSESNLEKIPF